MSTLHTSNDVHIVAKNARKFASALYTTIAEQEDNNIICSPLSVSVILSMLTYGAHEETERELKSVLRSADDTINKNGHQSLIDTFNAIKAVQLKLANTIFVGMDLTIRPEYQQLTETYFRSVTQNIDFTKSIEASGIINNWCAEKTNNRIKDIVQPSDMQGTSVVLVNAVYFKGNWRNKFNAAHTEPKTFYVDKTMTKEVPMMKRKGKYRLSEISELNARCIELPYQSNDETDQLSMFVLLPTEIDGLKAVENKLKTVDFLDVHKNSSYSSDIELELPKFKIESTMLLNAVLQTMGIKRIFEPDANFQRMSTTPMQVSTVIQKAFIEVNEEGSEAAAATAIRMVRCCAPMTPMTFVVDRPFFCTIVATHTGTQLFSARVIDPLI